MNLAECRALMGHAEWADSLIWKSVLALPEDQELRERLHHLHMVQWSYLHIWRGDPAETPELDSFDNAAAIRSWARGYYRELTCYFATVGDSILDREVRFPWAARLVKRFGGAAPATWTESVMQVVMHTSYHRGQVARRLRELGAEPPLTDFIAWIWMDRPVAQWGSDEAA
jgi:uncharacterized damage-inducible protein DinB